MQKDVSARDLLKEVNETSWPTLMTAIHQAYDLIEDLGGDPDEHLDYVEEKTRGRPRENVLMTYQAAFFTTVFLRKHRYDRNTAMKKYRELADLPEWEMQ